MVAPATTTTVVRRQLGRRLRALRERAGKTTADVEAAKLASTVKLWRIETGRTPVKVADVRALCWLYGTDAAATDELAALAESTVGRDWWQGTDQRLPGFDLYLGLEPVAAAISMFQPELVPGLLQTEDYARAVQWGTRLDPTPELVERDVHTRLARQRTVVGRNPPPRLEAVLTGWALTRPVGEPGVVERQREHLLALAATGTVDIAVLPPEAGPHPGFRGEFLILDFDDPADPAVVYVETDAGVAVVERPEVLTRQRRVLARLLELSVPIEEYPP